MVIINARWKMYLDYLEAHGEDYEQVFVTDTRDVIFQGDVFVAFKDCTKWLGYTTEADDIGGSKAGSEVNYKWFKRAFGAEKADKFLNKQIICCGTVIGTVAEMKVLCQAMWNELKEPGRFWGYEQALMNHLVYDNCLPIENLLELDVQNGEILTVGLYRLIYKIRFRDNFLLRGDGGIPAVLHQYDRAKEVVQLVDNLYRDKDFQAEEKFTDTRSNLEQVWHFLCFNKINEAIQFTAKMSVDANLDKDIAYLLRFWEKLFKKPSFTPYVGYLELSIQNALASVQNLSVSYLNVICARLNYSVKNGRVIAPQFVKFIAHSLLNNAEQSFNERNSHICSFCKETVNALPPDKNLYLLQAEAYRALGAKEEALTAYKKTLELS